VPLPLDRPVVPILAIIANSGTITGRHVKLRLLESAFAPIVDFGVLVTSKLGTNEILLRYIAALVP
jgi:hypothetical protein